jgi:hypothetical protein
VGVEIREPRTRLRSPVLFYRRIVVSCGALVVRR